MMDDRATPFQRHKPKLYGIAYRMLSSAADAEDILQDAYLRWHETDAGRIETDACQIVVLAREFVFRSFRQPDRLLIRLHLRGGHESAAREGRAGHP